MNMPKNVDCGAREEALEDALRDMDQLVTALQQRTGEYLPDGDTDQFVDDVIQLIDNPDQARIQEQASELLNKEGE